MLTINLNRLKVEISKAIFLLILIFCAFTRVKASQQGSIEKHNNESVNYSISNSVIYGFLGDEKNQHNINMSDSLALQKPTILGTKSIIKDMENEINSMEYDEEKAENQCSKIEDILLDIDSKKIRKKVKGYVKKIDQYRKKNKKSMENLHTKSSQQQQKSALAFAELEKINIIKQYKLAQLIQEKIFEIESKSREEKEKYEEKISELETKLKKAIKSDYDKELELTKYENTILYLEAKVKKMKNSLQIAKNERMIDNLLMQLNKERDKSDKYLDELKKLRILSGKNKKEIKKLQEREKEQEQTIKDLKKDLYIWKRKYNHLDSEFIKIKKIFEKKPYPWIGSFF